MVFHENAAWMRQWFHHTRKSALLMRELKEANKYLDATLTPIP